jgi:hypothetical protein
MDRPLIILLFLRKSENECKFFAVVGPFEDLLILCKYPKLIPILFKSARYIYKPFASSIDTISWFKFVKPWNCVKRLKRELCRRQCRFLFVVFSEHWKISYAQVISQFFSLVFNEDLFMRMPIILYLLLSITADCSEAMWNKSFRYASGFLSSS